MQWSRLLMHDVICSESVTIHFQWGRKVSLVTLTFDLDIQTRPSEGPQSLHVNLAQIRSAVPEIFHKQTKKVTGSAKTEPFAQFIACGNQSIRHACEHEILHGRKTVSTSTTIS